MRRQLQSAGACRAAVLLDALMQPPGGSSARHADEVHSCTAAASPAGGCCGPWSCWAGHALCAQARLHPHPSTVCRLMRKHAPSQQWCRREVAERREAKRLGAAIAKLDPSLVAAHHLAPSDAAIRRRDAPERLQLQSKAMELLVRPPGCPAAG